MIFAIIISVLFTILLIGALFIRESELRHLTKKYETLQDSAELRISNLQSSLKIANTSRQEAEVAKAAAEDQMTRMQATFAKFMASENDISNYRDRWNAVAIQALLKVEESQRMIRFAVSEPQIRFDPAGPLATTREHAMLLPMIRFGFQMALSEHTPPELICEYIAQDLKAAILKQWRSQSILLNI